MGRSLFADFRYDHSVINGVRLRPTSLTSSTQIPYALTAGVVATLAGSLPAGFGVPVWLCLTAGVAVLVGIITIIGKPASIREADQPNN